VKNSLTLLLAVVALSGVANVATAFVPAARWSNTATDGFTGSDGESITLTWSIVPDGTPISGEAESSDLVAFLDGIYGGAQQELEEKPWFELLEQSFDRWSELGGINYVYSPNDDGAEHGSASGALNQRGDVRLAGAPIDGDSGTLAYNTFPNGGDMVIDTSDIFYDFTTRNSRRLRNVVMHEAGHGFGLDHIVSNGSQFLLEPFISVDFDGPQYDDIRGLQHLYGDAFEQANNGAGNNIATNATSLGLVSDGGLLSIGTDTGFETKVTADQTDFVSLANDGDVDYFSFSISEPTLLDINLTPVGATFTQGSDSSNNTQFVTASLSDLTLTLFDSDGTTLLDLANDTPAGSSEAILDYPLDTAGQYYVRVTGSADVVQFYELSIAAEAYSIVVPNPAGDFNGDGLVDLADYTVWRDQLGQVGSNLAGDGNGNGIVETGDYAVWRTGFGAGVAGGSDLAVANVPEPATGWLLLLAAASGYGLAGLRNRPHPLTSDAH